MCAMMLIHPSWVSFFKALSMVLYSGALPFTGIKRFCDFGVGDATPKADHYTAHFLRKVD
jgi:hypothetical protein